MNQIQSYQLSISGMKCASCVSAVEKSLQSEPGVMSALVNFANHSVVVKTSLPSDKIIELVQQAGFDAVLANDNQDLNGYDEQEAIHYKTLLRRFIFAALLGTPLMVAGHLSVLPALSDAFWFWLMVAILTLLVLYYSGGHFFRGAFNAIKHGQFNMDTLVALGTGSAWLYSMVVVLYSQQFTTITSDIYFEASMIVVAFINFGSSLEAKVRNKTSSVIRSLIELQPKTATVVREGETLVVDIKKVGLNEIIKIYPGEKISVDGVLIEGESSVDESMLTGEAMPVDKTIGDKLAAGTVNKTGSFLMQSTHIGKDTALAHIIQSVQNAQNTKPRIAKIADKIASIFVPIVLMIAVITFASWLYVGAGYDLAFVTTMCVLVIACPCALGLATPISVIVAVGRSAKMGVLIREGNALQKLQKVTYLLLDKTGTITEGKPVVSNIRSFDGFSKKDVLIYAASLEQYSEHPIAKAITSITSTEKLYKTTDFIASIGRGVQGVIDGKSIHCGGRKMMDEIDLNFSDHQDFVKSCEQTGQTVMYLASDNKPIGLIAVSDIIKDDSKAAIDCIRALGVQVMMLTGDTTLSAQSIAQQVGIKLVHAQMSPQNKAQIVKDLQSKGEVVVMVGDGINDAPALAQADVGIAIGTGTDVAIESADMVISFGALTKVSEAICLSKATMRNIKQNFFSAFLYNITAIPLAAGLFYPLFGFLLNPMVAGLAMALSSISVVGNANRLRWISLKPK